MRRAWPVISCLVFANAFVSVPPQPLTGKRSARVVLAKSSDEEPLEPLNPDLIAGDVAVLLAAACYQQLVGVLVDESFPGWATPLTVESFENLPNVVGATGLWSCLWIIAGMRHRVFSATYTTGFAQLLNTGVDAACLRVALEILRLVVTHEPTSCLVLLTNTADNVLWLLVWRYLRLLVLWKE